MHFYGLFAFALLQPGLVCASQEHEYMKPGAETNTTLYAYGTNSSQWPISFRKEDELLYIAENPDNEEANLVPVEWDLASITGKCWIANATYTNGSHVGSMFVMPKQDYAVGILPVTRAAYINGTVSGFALFALQLVYGNNTLLEAQFWAKATNWTGVYGLTWTLDDSNPNGELPVIVKALEDSTSRLNSSMRLPDRGLKSHIQVIYPSRVR